MDADERAALIAAYEAGPDVVDQALADIGPDALDRRPPDGSWSAREVVHHLADSEMRSAIRLRRLLTEDEPTIIGYDEAAYADAFRYAERPIEPALVAFRGARSTTAQILRKLDHAAFARTGTHAESGPYGVEHWLRSYAEHAPDHADQIRRAGGATTDAETSANRSPSGVSPV
jgi:DinB family protein